VNPAGIGQTLPQGVEYVRILPEIVLSLFGMLIMVLDPLVDERRSQRLLGFIALIGSVAAIASALYQSQYPGLGFWGMVKVDAFSTFFHVLITAIAAVVILSSYEYMEVQRIRAGEYYGLILFGAVGMCLMSSAVELVLIFIALEISSISTYVLAGFRRRAAISSEASLKYFLLGSFATAFFLYGVALMFGATGSTSIAVIGESLRSNQIPLLAYADARKRGKQIVEITARRAMPPWLPDGPHGEFTGDRRLTDGELDLLRRWLEDGLMEGEARDLPSAPRFASEWPLGQPDLVATLPASSALPADGPDIYRIFVLPLPLKERRFVRAVDFRAGSAAIHHAMIGFDRSGQARRKYT